MLQARDSSRLAPLRLAPGGQVLGLKNEGVAVDPPEVVRGVDVLRVRGEEELLVHDQPVHRSVGGQGPHGTRDSDGEAREEDRHDNRHEP